MCVHITRDILKSENQGLFKILKQLSPPLRSRTSNGSYPIMKKKQTTQKEKVETLKDNSKLIIMAKQRVILSFLGMLK